jgi:hypothetical protein
VYLQLEFLVSASVFVDTCVPASLVVLMFLPSLLCICRPCCCGFLAAVNLHVFVVSLRCWRPCCCFRRLVVVNVFLFMAWRSCCCCSWCGVLAVVAVAAVPDVAAADVAFLLSRQLQASLLLLLLACRSCCRGCCWRLCSCCS